jgi:hypothetical protein
MPARARTETDRVTCAVEALYLYLQTVSREVPLRKLASEFSPPNRGGHSMYEIARVARRHGVGLTGIALKGRSRTLREPMIAYLKRSDHSHFVVLRPIGTSGELVQVLDPSGGIRSVDYDAFQKIAGWTGMVLVRTKPSLFLRATPWLISSVVGVLVARGVVAMVRRRGLARGAGSETTI